MVVVALAAGACKEEPGAVRVFVAASAAELVEEWSRDAGVAVQVNAAASSTLARQIEAGAPADLYLSANIKWMDRLDKAGLLEPGSRRDVLKNELVLASPKEDGLPQGAEADLPKAVRRCVAVADPEHVPAGIYAKQALQARGWWDALQGRIVPAADVRATMALVARGECDAGLVYSTDLVAAPAARRVSAPGGHDPVVYPAAAVKGRLTPDAKKLLDHMVSDAGRAAAQARGFVR